VSRAKKVRVKWLAEFCIVDQFQFATNEVFELPSDWQEWAIMQGESGRLEILAPEEIKTDVQT
jgi:hypothetical protein